MLLTEYGWEVQPEWLVWLPGLVTGLNLACRAAAVRGEEVITAVPVYPPFLSRAGLEPPPSHHPAAYPGGRQMDLGL